MVTVVKDLWKTVLVLSKGCSTSWSHRRYENDEFQKSLEAEPREPREMVPKRYRGNPQSPAEELRTATLTLCTAAFEQCRREVEDEGDLDPPQETPSPQVVVEAFVASPYRCRWASNRRDQSKWLALGIFTATKDSILGTVKRRAELVLLTEGKTSPQIRDEEVASSRLWRLSAVVLGKHGW